VVGIWPGNAACVQVVRFHDLRHTLAANEVEVRADVDELDANPWLLNVANGTIDLRTGGIDHTCTPRDPACQFDDGVRTGVFA
jgi:phage/plasmid-associated DNA primase